ncbi:hypothetical protein PR048_017177 [Dryococelus australis]|uniref:Uncharacterized protein n=1 Tax=Dryococelus australis TaxID=614101 RepID=A0ABQ9H8T7_9NEOP|nr:hypothetical protein PR048_017177 [Dryococelus australis]
MQVDIFHAMLEEDSQDFEQYLRQLPVSSRVYDDETTPRKCIPHVPPLFPACFYHEREHSRSPYCKRYRRWMLPSPLRGYIAWMPISATASSSPSSPAEAFLSPERVLTPVPWSVYTPCSTTSVGRLEDLDDVGEDEEDVTLWRLHAEVRLFQEEITTATHTSCILCDRNYALHLEEVRILCASVRCLCDVILPPEV